MSAKKSPRKNVPAEPSTIRLGGVSAAPGEPTSQTLPFPVPGNSRNGQRKGHAADLHPSTERSRAMTAKKTSEKPPNKKKSAKAKPQHAQKAAVDATPKKLSALNAAVRVLEETKQAMSCPELIEVMAKKGYWTSPGGKTPAATLYSSMLRELQKKGKEARFKKTERGKFARA
ncbi:MAG TPA: winged helix-turn-helix domain-containing protein [Gemmataceae bacterium]|nr:winged helix-turn-helix domain-containing protein [Gemmataceae bacterium]